MLTGLEITPSDSQSCTVAGTSISVDQGDSGNSIAFTIDAAEAVTVAQISFTVPADGQLTFKSGRLKQV